VHKREPFTRYSVVALLGPDRMKMIKRVVGFPGEKIEIKGNQLYLNDKPILLPTGVGPFLSLTRGTGIGCEGRPITLGPNEYFVLGDNAPVSGDSRYWHMGIDGHQPGALPRDRILGTATWIYWPPKRWARLDDLPPSVELESQ
jgi:signal peptidase I